ncbi:putative T6SS immunity periplasmic lipoprotein [Citrobacter sp. R-1.5.2]|uniref:putative T6SS immunity periplasmic lipoprotein n=1 Tax=Citrobacter sp. R-1.5.2 TaxID=3046183 RepID=UPI002B248BC6|nr:putative T6SS immunity periplasmic lipoprotein [Citrobacter sp. R-1.5.2]MEB2420612.1 hypothetical protein [Citrobacter sp. R-1.5.2]
MVKIKQKHSILFFVLCVISIFILTGCPWGGMKYYPAETANVWMKNHAVCFYVPDSKDYQPVFISINPRGTSSKERQFTEQPKLRITDGQLCISPSFYSFPYTSKKAFIVEIVLRSQDRRHHPRSFVTGFEMINGRARNVPLTTREFDVPETSR